MGRAQAKCKTERRWRCRSPMWQLGKRSRRVISLAHGLSDLGEPLSGVQPIAVPDIEYFAFVSSNSVTTKIKRASFSHIVTKKNDGAATVKHYRKIFLGLCDAYFAVRASGARSPLKMS